jgi:hypothetical protein
LVIRDFGGVGGKAFLFLRVLHALRVKTFA